MASGAVHFMGNLAPGNGENWKKKQNNELHIVTQTLAGSNDTDEKCCGGHTSCQALITE